VLYSADFGSKDLVWFGMLAGQLQVGVTSSGQPFQVLLGVCADVDFFMDLLVTYQLFAGLVFTRLAFQQLRWHASESFTRLPDDT
jgi:hypothetical protein